jgi:hypothetical protein
MTREIMQFVAQWVVQGGVGEGVELCARECVCVFLASGYIWVTVMHAIPISSAHTMTYLPYPRT